mgnify:CR=1 FL=1
MPDPTTPSAPATQDIGKRIVEAYPKAEPIIDLLLDAAAAVGAHPVWLANLIDFESARSWSPSKKNSVSNAVGLIQFLPSTAADLLDIPPDWTTKKGYPRWKPENLKRATEMMAALDARRQMQFVRAFLRQWARYAKGPLDTKHKLYMAVYHPAAIKRDPNAFLSDDPKELAAIRAANTPKGGTPIDTPAKYSAMLEKGRLQA